MAVSAADVKKLREATGAAMLDCKNALEQNNGDFEKSLEWLKEKRACREGVAWFNAQDERDEIKLLEKLMAEDHFDWANWFIVQVMGYKQYVSYAVFAARQMLDIYEKRYLKDVRSRNTIETAEKCIESPTKKNKAAAYAASAAAASSAAEKQLQKKIIEYGISLLK